MQTQYSIKQLSRVLRIAESNHYQRANRVSAHKLTRSSVKRSSPGLTKAAPATAAAGSGNCCWHRGNDMARLGSCDSKACVPNASELTTTDSNHDHPIAENWLRPNQIWASDITYIPTKEGWLYLAGTLGLCTRKCVG
jgi:hypothetical protein